ncbi:MAG: DUF177 domain-containing protein [Pseudomonadota bacterium]
MTQLPRSTLRVADLRQRTASAFDLVPTAEERAAVAEALGISGIKKLRFEGKVMPKGGKDWALEATLGATVVQPCVVTLAPVSTRVDENITRSYLTEVPEITAGEAEMPEDDTVEPLPDTIDLVAVMIEALSLALPAYPRSEGAALEQTSFAAPGVTPMTDDDAKPFAGLQDLKDRLENKGE